MKEKVNFQRYAEDLQEQNEKYKRKDFNLENEIVALRESSQRLTISLAKEKQKYEQGLQEQKELIKRNYDAKLLALERSLQGRSQEQCKALDQKVIALNEEINSHVIENQNLRIEVDCARSRLTDADGLKVSV